MRRRDVLGMTLIAVPTGQLAAQGKRLPQVGIMTGGPSAVTPSYVSAFSAGLAESGYTAERDVALLYRFHQQESERMAQIADEFVRQGVDVIVAAGTSSTHAAKRATDKIPIVMIGVAEPVKDGLVA